MEELDAFSRTAVLQFPRIERYALATDIRKTISTMIHLTIRCAKRYYKKTSLQDLDIEVAYLKALIRTSYRLGYINVHKYEVWIRHVIEIGKMCGGWINNLK